MEIRQEKLLDFLGTENTRFVIPMFQRVYSWDARQCTELWEDIMRAGADDSTADAEPHFMGMILYSSETESFNGNAQLNIIDGQQRVTTASLLLCALARHLDETGATADGLTARDLFERYLRVGGNAQKSGKLVLSFMDRDTLFALVGAKTMPEEPAGRLIDNLELFYGRMQEPGFDAKRLWRGIGRLQVATVLLGHDDSPQLVFESLNSKGMALVTADRIRNFCVVSDDGAGQSADGVLERCWMPLEPLVAEANCDLSVNEAVNAWLASKYRGTRIFDESEVYGVFKSCLREDYDGDVAALIADLSDYAATLIADEDLRTESLENAARWIAGKPKDLISEYKMFGD